MAIAEQSPRRRFTVDEVLRMVETGVLEESEPLELLDGELVVVTAQGPIHSSLTEVIRRALESVYGAGFHTRCHSPVDAADPSNLPEPDVAVVRGQARDFLSRHPGAQDLVLVIEVARTSQALDREKAHLYARAGVPVNWLVDLTARQVEVYSEPGPAGDYAERRTYREGDEVPVPGTEISLPVNSLLP